MLGMIINPSTFLINDAGVEITEQIEYILHDNTKKIKTVYLVNGYSVDISAVIDGMQPIELY